jgi:hypothetical protein
MLTHTRKTGFLIVSPCRLLAATHIYSAEGRSTERLELPKMMRVMMILKIAHMPGCLFGPCCVWQPPAQPQPSSTATAKQPKTLSPNCHASRFQLHPYTSLQHVHV